MHPAPPGFHKAPFEPSADPALIFHHASLEIPLHPLQAIGAAKRVLTGLQLWILDCLRDAPHATHSHTAQSLEWIAELSPARAVLTHLNQQIDYADLAARCPPGVEPAYDGLAIEL